MQLLSVHNPDRTARVSSSDHAEPFSALSLQSSYPGRKNVKPRLKGRDRLIDT